MCRWADGRAGATVSLRPIGVSKNGGVWNDQACSQTRAFVCEVRPDDCPSDAGKIAPGQCGCGMAETDTDNDVFADCAESCDVDVNKQAPGVCGCGTADDDGDGEERRHHRGEALDEESMHEGVW